MNIGDSVKDISIQNQRGENIKFSNYKGKWIVLYFYPKDNTPGCTIEAEDFTKFKTDFESQGAVILGASPDSLKSHNNFIEKKSLGIDLLSDPEHELLEYFGAWRMKKMYGREFMGVVRSTALIDPDSKLAFFWDNVKAKGHAEKVLEKLKELKG